MSSWAEAVSVSCHIVSSGPRRPRGLERLRPGAAARAAPPGSSGSGRGAALGWAGGGGGDTGFCVGLSAGLGAGPCWGWDRGLGGGGGWAPS